MLVFAMLAIPGKDAFNFMADLASYPMLVRMIRRLPWFECMHADFMMQIFQSALVVGLLLLRKRRALEGTPPSMYQAKSTFIVVFFASSILLLVLPWFVPH